MYCEGYGESDRDNTNQTILVDPQSVDKTFFMFLEPYCFGRYKHLT